MARRTQLESCTLGMVPAPSYRKIKASSKTQARFSPHERSSALGQCGIRQARFFMARVVFTSHLEPYLDCPVLEASARCMREVLEAVFEQNPRLRGYIVDEAGAI